MANIRLGSTESYKNKRARNVIFNYDNRHKILSRPNQRHKSNRATERILTAKSPNPITNNTSLGGHWMAVGVMIWK